MYIAVLHTIENTDSHDVTLPQVVIVDTSIKPASYVVKLLDDGSERHTELSRLRHHPSQHPCPHPHSEDYIQHVLPSAPPGENHNDLADFHPGDLCVYLQHSPDSCAGHKCREAQVYFLFLISLTYTPSDMYHCSLARYRRY